MLENHYFIIISAANILQAKTQTPNENYRVWQMNSVDVCVGFISFLFVSFGFFGCVVHAAQFSFLTIKLKTK